MAGLTFLTAQQELADRLNLDQTVSANATRLQRWLNLAQQDITSRYNFSWLETRGSIQTRKQETAGTVTVSLAGTTVTGSSTAFSTTNDPLQYIQLGSNSDLYYITAVASTTSLTIEQPLIGAALSGAAYTLTPVFYDLPVNAQRVVDIRQFNTPMKLTQIGESTLDLFEPDLSKIGPPTAYSVIRNDPAIAAGTAKQLQISLWPIPDAVYNLEVRYVKVLTDLSANGDISEIPVQWHGGPWVTCAEWLGQKFLNDPDVENTFSEYQGLLAMMISQDNDMSDYHAVLQSSDSVNATRFVPFPTAFEQPY